MPEIRKWDHLPTVDQNEALDAAIDALTRRARILAGQDPEVAAALLSMVAEIGGRFAVQLCRSRGEHAA